MENNMTEKIYYIDAYVRNFSAKVISMSRVDDGYDVVLDRTAFFPEEGGQGSDGGHIGGCEVIHVYEKDGVVHHITKEAPRDTEVVCEIDFNERFEKMQCHTAEHILCGIIHRLYGFDNVGFHLGDDEVTFDVNGVLDRRQLDEVEDIANNAVFANLKVESFFPATDELKDIEYRAKLDLVDGVRIVKIEDIDTCACCAPHVSRTGEIGAIKLLDFMKHRGGTRITMVAGRRALKDYRLRYENDKRISAALSVPQPQIADAVDAYLRQAESTATSLKQARLLLAEARARDIDIGAEENVYLLSDFSVAELIAFSNVACPRRGRTTVALCGRDGDYKYVISSADTDLTKEAKNINSALNGRGGGKPHMIQGSFSCSLEEIRNFFNKK